MAKQSSNRNGKRNTNKNAWHPLDNEAQNEQQAKKKKVVIIPRSVTQESYLSDIFDENVSIVFGVGPAGTGKAQPLTSKILTPNGWVSMGSITVGSMVMNRHGVPANVTGVYPQGMKEIYTIKTADGRQTRCCLEHLWTLADGETISTKEMKNRVDLGNDVFLPVCEAIQFPAHSFVIPRIAEDIIDNNLPGDDYSCYKGGVPYAWLHGSVIQREELFDRLWLEGCTPGDNMNHTTTSNQYVAEAIEYLERSLGGSVIVQKSDNIYDIVIAETPIETVTKVVSITHDSVEDAQCIMVDTPEHLYITDDFMVTHNTMIAVEAAIKGYQDGEYSSIVITRPNVEVDDRSIGFLPGTLHEKMAPWLMPIMDVFAKYYSQKEIARMIDENIIRIIPIAFFRGMTYTDSFVIIDESQGLSASAMKAVLTRIGEGSKMVLTGDEDQSDIGVNNGLSDFMNRYDNNPRISITKFTSKDIQRHPVISDILKMYDR